jgi:hypothetical protein
MSAIQTRIGRLSFPVLILLHIFGTIFGAGLFLVLGAIGIVFLHVKDDSNSASIMATSLLVGAILPNLLFWHSRNRYFREALPRHALEPESIRNVSLTLDSSEENSSIQALTETPLTKTAAQPVRRYARNHLRDVAEYNQAQRQANIQGPNDDRISSQESYGPSTSSNVHSLLKQPSRRWRWWHTLSTVLSVIVIIAIFFPAINIPIEPSVELELTRKGLLFEDQGNAIDILNVGSKQIEITGMSINDRLDCTINGVSIFTEGVEKKPLPKELKVGDSLAIWSSCRIIRVTIETGTGPKTYSFGRE